MYDLDSDDKISRDELLAVLHMMVGDNISEEQVKDDFTKVFFLPLSWNIIYRYFLGGI